VESKLVKLDILLNATWWTRFRWIVPAIPLMQGSRLAEMLKENIPRQMFEIPIQAASEARLFPRTVRPCARTFWPSATAATSPVKKTSGKAEGRQKEDAPAGYGAGAQRGVHRRAQAGRMSAAPGRRSFLPLV
jgi:hypothetical protein